MTSTTLSISGEKSTCPGVSNSVKVRSSAAKIACLEKIVMPRFFSMASVSKKASPWSTRPVFLIALAWYKSPSEVLVLPASTWAKMPRDMYLLSKLSILYSLTQCERAAPIADRLRYVSARHVAILMNEIHLLIQYLKCKDISFISRVYRQLRSLCIMSSASQSLSDDGLKVSVNWDNPSTLRVFCNNKFNILLSLYNINTLSEFYTYIHRYTK